MHLTIKNIRVANRSPSYKDSDMEIVKEVFKKIIPRHKAFSFKLKELMQFPTSLSILGYSSENLYKLIYEIDKELKTRGVSDNKKYVSDKVYFGNITICRLTKKPGSKFIKKCKELEGVKVSDLVIDKVSLITCNSVCSPESLQVIDTFSLN